MNYWYIWNEVFENGKSVSRGRYPRAYKHKSSAQRRAKQMWGEPKYDPIADITQHRIWIISQTNPWEDVYIFKTKAEAGNVLNGLRLMINRYGFATRADLKELMKQDAYWFDYRCGWMECHLNKGEIIQTASGYTLKMPTALIID